MHSQQVVFDASSRELRFQTSEVGRPSGGAIVARVTMAGVCGTDHHRLRGDVPGDAWPVMFGHEVVGSVVDVGEGATDWRGDALEVGDRITWFPASAGCDQCEACADQMWILCQTEKWPSPADEPNAAGFQEIATIGPRVPVYRLDQDTSDAAYTAFGCALPTAIEGVDVIGGIGENDTVVVQGAGPVGLAYTAVVAAQRPAQLIVIGAPESRLQWASILGATTVLDITATSAAERAAEVQALTGGRGADVVFEAAGHAAAFPEGLELLARRGRYQITGLFSGSQTVAVDPVVINNKLLTIRGAYGALPRHREAAVDLVPQLERDHRISRLLQSTFPLAQTKDAIVELGSGNATKTAVTP